MSAPDLYFIAQNLAKKKGRIIHALLLLAAQPASFRLGFYYNIYKRRLQVQVRVKHKINVYFTQ